MLVSAFAFALAACGGSKEQTQPGVIGNDSAVADSESPVQDPTPAPADPDKDSDGDNVSLPPVISPPVEVVNPPVEAVEPPVRAAVNLINPALQWRTWEGGESAVSYEPTTDSLKVSGSANANHGVQRYLSELTSGQRYELSFSVLSGAPQVTATLYLYRQDGSPIDFTNETNGTVANYHAATLKDPVQFVAPQGVTGFAIQVSSLSLSQSSQLKLAFNAVGVTSIVSNHADFRPAGFDTLLLSDEFSGNELDRSRWCTRLAYGGGPALQVPDAQCTRFPYTGVADYANPDENQRFRDFNRLGQPLHEVSNGTLKLHATLTGVNTATRFESAAIRSKTAFKPSQTTDYYLTSRVKLPDILGIWPAMFVIPGLGDNGIAQWPPEIDIFEGAINGGDGENSFTLIQHAQVQGAQTDSGRSEWFYAAPGFATTWGFWRSPYYLREQWIEVGALWHNEGVCYFVDGIKTGCEHYRWVTNDGQPANAAELVMQLAVGGLWAGRNGVDDSAFPTFFEIDHIRVYQRQKAQ